VTKPSAALVLRLLEEHPDGLTQLEVLALGGGDSLAQRVHELIDEGRDIRGSFEATPSGKRVKRYRLARRAIAEPMRGSQQRLALL
jgi:hypothetical protein